MNYRLLVLTHGNGPCLEQTLASFHENVRPWPLDAVVWDDGNRSRARELVERYSDWPWLLDGTTRPRGFCDSTAALWQHAATAPTEHVFWLEHDFTFERPVDLRELALVLEGDPRLAQVALKRQPVSPEEIAAGGYVELRPDEYHQTFVGTPDRLGQVRYLDHGLFWTTNPSLFESSLAAARPWPRVSECEGHFGLDLVRRNYRFALLGARDDPPAVRHIGVRSGFGY